MSVILIAGPTASGKSSAAIGVAKKCNGVVVNADSMQVYKVLQILTSRPGPDDVAQVDHALYGYISPTERFTVARWLEDAGKEIAGIIKSGRTPIITGGTGLYFKALENGLAQVPEIPTEITQNLRKKFDAYGIEPLQRQLLELMPKEAARFKPADSQRIMRALEVVLATGKPLTYFHEQAQKQSLLTDHEVQRFVVNVPREQLYARINKRFAEMVEEGAIEEVRALLEMELAPDLPAMKAIGVRPLAGYLAGEVSLEDAVERSCQETRNYAIRQMTWARNQMSHWNMVNSGEEIMGIMFRKSRL